MAKANCRKAERFYKKRWHTVFHWVLSFCFLVFYAANGNSKGFRKISTIQNIWFIIV
jgi:thiosulfate reductase cytochrome b subunit